MQTPILLTLLAICAGCVGHGESLRDVTPALQPRGVEATIKFARGEIGGELLQTTDSAIYIVHVRQRKVVRIAGVHIRSSRFGKLKYKDNPLANAEQVRALRQRSRFSHGLSPELFNQVLQTYGQTEPIEYRPR